MQVNITIDLNKKCAECHKGGAVDNGLCLACTAEIFQGGPMRSAEGKALQQRLRNIKNRRTNTIQCLLTSMIQEKVGGGKTPFDRIAAATKASTGDK